MKWVGKGWGGGWDDEVESASMYQWRMLLGLLMGAFWTRPSLSRFWSHGTCLRGLGGNGHWVELEGLGEGGLFVSPTSWIYTISNSMTKPCPVHKWKAISLEVLWLSCTAQMKNQITHPLPKYSLIAESVWFKKGFCMPGRSALYEPSVSVTNRAQPPVTWHPTTVHRPLILVYSHLVYSWFSP